MFFKCRDVFFKCMQGCVLQVQASAGMSSLCVRVCACVWGEGESVAGCVCVCVCVCVCAGMSGAGMSSAGMSKCRGVRCRDVQCSSADAVVCVGGCHCVGWVCVCGGGGGGRGWQRERDVQHTDVLFGGVL